MTHILIIDDDNELRGILRMALAREGYEVSEAANGREGIRAFQKRRVDLILCDLIMSEKDGLETIRELHDQFGEVKIIAMSGGALGRKLDLLPFAKKLGATQLLKKPFDLTTLLKTMGEVLQGSLTPEGRRQHAAES
jgi:DNA-binding NtrC family response regulator